MSVSAILKIRHLASSDRNPIRYITCWHLHRDAFFVFAFHIKIDARKHLHPDWDIISLFQQHWVSNIQQPSCCHSIGIRATAHCQLNNQQYMALIDGRNTTTNQNKAINMCLNRLPWTKWLPFRRRYFHMHFREWKVCILIKISLKIVAKGPIDNNPPLF